MALVAEADPVVHPRAGTVVPEVPPARSRWRLPLMLVVPLIAIVAGLWYWFGSPGTVSTDNAYIKQDIVSIASQVTGMVATVHVRENQHVRAGDILYTIDPSTFQVAIAQADAQIASAQAGVTALQADVGANAADLAGARDDLALAEANFAREKALMERGFNTRAKIDAASHAVAAARDELASIGAQVAKARAQLATGAQVPGVNPAIAVARSQRAQAELNLSRTVVRAPADGIVTQASRLMVGQMAFLGVPMLSLVRDGGARVDANFKETDLAHMRPGQPADLHFDAYPGLKLKGHVESIGAGTGSEFSILPAQNATGNWVKITQRVPVRIAIDSKSDRPLIAGLSSNVSVHVGH
jgi:membrane fusion protein (multidrug efflux system)